MFLVFQIIAFDIVPADSKYNKENTCDRQPMFQYRLPRVQISIRERFSKSALLRLTKKFYKSSLMDISQVFCTV